MYVKAAGLVCAVGLDAPAACAAFRAGISGFTELPYHESGGEAIVGARVPVLEQRLKLDERVLRLLEMSLRDLLGRVKLPPAAQVPLLVGLPEPERPGGMGNLAASIVGRVQDRLGQRFHSASGAFATGHTAGLLGLRTARDLLQNAKVPACIVCAADSFLNAPSLLWLERHMRLKTPTNSDGTIPGEAGAAILVTSTAGDPAVKVRALGFAEEKAHLLCDEPLLGLGMSTAARQALDSVGLTMPEVDFRISDLTGEQYGFKEMALVQARLMRVRREEQPLWHPTQSVGDTGAAASLVGLIVAREAFAKGYAPGPRLLLFTGSTGGARAVALVERG